MHAILDIYAREWDWNSSCGKFNSEKLIAFDLENN